MLATLIRKDVFIGKYEKKNIDNFFGSDYDFGKLCRL